MKFYIVAVMALFICGAAEAQESRVALHNNNGSVTAAYASIRSLGRAEGARFYKELPSDMQADVWTVHLARFVSVHPEITDDQRALIYEALGMLSSDMGQRIVNGSRSEADRAQTSLRNFKMRTLVAFPRALAQEAFSDLGVYATQDEVRSRRAATSEFRLRIATESVPKTPECNCTLGNSTDFCDQVTNPSGYYCNAKDCISSSWGCGWIWWEPCTGVCGER